LVRQLLYALRMLRNHVSSLLLPLMAGLTLLAATGCPDRAVTEVDPNQQKEEQRLIPVNVNRDLDILFVIDNSGSMAGEQASLAANFGNFMSVLNNIDGGLPNVHIGIVSSDVGAGQACSTNDNGTLQNRATFCNNLSNGARFISDIDDGNGGRTRNYTGTLEETFSCMAQLGVNGCGLERHLESMKRALDGSNAANANFLRPDAFLAVVLIADEDDCSAANDTLYDPNNGALGPLNSFRCTEYGVECAEGLINRDAHEYTNCKPREDHGRTGDGLEYHPDHYVDFLKSLKPNDPNRIIMAGIIGNPEPVGVEIITDSQGHQVADLKRSCLAPGADPNDPNAGARPAVRMDYLLKQFPNRNTFTSICDNDLSSALTKVAQLLANVVGNPCLSANIKTDDINPSEPGVQIECSVMDVTNPNTENEVSHTLPRCHMTSETTPDPTSTQPCWYTIADPVCDAKTSGLTVKFLPDPRDEAPSGTYTYVNCVAK
jgi:hypothetical protein